MQDGYKSLTDGYFAQQISVRLTDDDWGDLQNINKTFFEGELTNSMLARILIRKGVQWYKNLK